MTSVVWDIFFGRRSGFGVSKFSSGSGGSEILAKNGWRRRIQNRKRGNQKRKSATDILVVVVEASAISFDARAPREENWNRKAVC